jgi:hypothetical protein
VWKDRNIIALLPLYIKKKRKFILTYKYLAHLCFQHAGYCSFLINKNNNYKSIFKILSKYVIAISKTCNFIRIENISIRNEALIYFFIKLKTKMHKSQLFSTTESPILNLKSISNIDKSEYINALRRRKNIKVNNSYKFNINDINNPLSWDKMFLFRMEKYGANSIFVSDKNRLFFQSLTNAKLSTLEINNEIVAVHYGFAYKSKFYYYIPAYAQKMKKSGVGRILMLELIEWCKNNNIEEFNLLRGLEYYKFSWSNKILENKIFFAIVNNTTKNKLIYYLYLILVFYYS